MLPTFANPEWLWCLLLLLPLIGLRLWAQFRTHVLSGLVSPRLRSDLIVGAHPWGRWGIFTLHTLALAALLLAMARPQMGFEVTETESEGRNVIIAIDTSRSMLANDLLPDRMTRAKLAAQDIVNELPEDRIGLIAFAGRAFLQAPLTLDHDAVIEAILQFDTEIIPRGGTNLASAVGLALETFRKAGSTESALILFSDGENLEGEEEMDQLKEKAADLGTVLVAVGVGTETGAIIPEPDDNGRNQPGVFIKDDVGNVVRTRLDPSALQALSRQVGSGIYVNLGATTSIASIVRTALQKIEATREAGETRRRPIERFMWPLALAFALMMTAFLLPGSVRIVGDLLAPQNGTRATSPRPSRLARNSLLSATFLLVAGTANTVSARQDGDSVGFASLRDEDYASAIEAFEREIAEAHASRRQAWLNLGMGSAAYRKGDYELAKNAFGKALEQPDRRLSETAHYNLGNTLYRHGEAVLQSALGGGRPDLPQVESNPDKEAIAEQWRSAIEHYEQALKINPANRAAKHNLDVVRKRLEVLENPPPEQEQEQNQQNEQEKNEQEQEQEQEQQEKNEQEQPQQPQNQQEQPQNPEDQEKNDPGENEQEAKPEDKPPGEDQPPDSPPEQNQNQGNNQPQNPGDQPPPPPEPPAPEGDLEANPDQSEPQEQEPGEMNPAENEVNPDTGFSPTEARQKLRTLTDEDLDVRPKTRAPQKAKRYKNW